MYCNKCGAAVVGKFCSCCGTKVRSQIEEFRLLERRAEREFKRECTDNGRADLCLHHLATACWFAALLKYRKAIPDVPFAEAVNSIDQVKHIASVLFRGLKDF